MGATASGVTVPVRSDSGTAKSIDPAALHVAGHLCDALDVNEHVRDIAIKYRESAMRGRSRLQVERAIGKLARAHSLMSAALRDIEQAGGAE